MAQLAISAVGAGIGGYFGGPSGAALGWSLGSIVGSIVFQPDGPHTRAPRLDDRSVQSSTQGQPITRVYGAAMRVAGNMFWATEIEEHEHEMDVPGAKGGGGAGSHTTYSYTANFAIGLCEGPIAGILKLWADGKLIYDQSDPEDIRKKLVSTDVAEKIAFYYGDEEQLPDPTMEAIEGVGNVPGYRGLAYVVFEDFELEDFGNRIPNITALVANAVNEDNLGPVVDGRPDTSGPNIHESSFGEPGGFTWSRTDQGLIEYIGNVQWLDSGSPYRARTYYKRRYSVEGEFLEETFEQVSVASGSASVACGSAYGLAIEGPVRQTDWISAHVREQSGCVCNYAVWVRPGTIENILFPLQDPDGRIFCSIDGVSQIPGLGSNTAYTFGLVQAFGEYVYAVPGAGGAVLSERIYRFPYLNGTIHWQADEEYSGSEDGGYTDMSIDETGIWLVGANTSAIPNEGFLVRLSLDLEFIERWTIPNPSDTVLTGPMIKDDLAVYGSMNLDSGRWFIVRRNDDETVDTVATGLATGSGSQQGFAPVLQGIGLLQREQWIMPGGQVGGVLLSDVVSQINQYAGYTPADFDVSELTLDLVRGYPVTRPESSRATLLPLQQGFFFDIIEEDWKLKYPKRGKDPLLTIPEENLAAHLFGSERPENLLRNRTQEMELPRRVHVQFTDVDRDYQAGEQYAGRLWTLAKNINVVTIPVVFTATEARRIADALLYDAWVSRDSYEFHLGPEYLALSPGDGVTIENGNGTHYVRITNTDRQLPTLMHCRGVSVYPAAYTEETLAPGLIGGTYESPAVGTETPVESPIVGALVGPTLFVIIDAPIVRDADDNAAVYYAVRGYIDDYRGAVVYKSLDGTTYVEIDSHTTQAVMGYTTNALGSPVSGITIEDERSSVNVRVNGALASIDDAAFYNRQQAFFIGAHGRWEVIVARDVTLESDGTYTLSHFLRGLKGTDHNVGNHQANDFIVLATEAGLDRFPVELTEVGVERQYKGVSIGGTVQETEAQDFTLELEALKPLSPVHIRGQRNNAGDLRIEWIRRTRVGGANDISGFTPLGETSESYEVEILNGGSVVRTIADTDGVTTYTAAQQTTDFGSPQASINGRIHQISSTVGDGHDRTFTL